MFRKTRGIKSSRNRRLVFVTEEHCGDLVEKYFTTLDRVEEEHGPYYAAGALWGDYPSLTDEVKSTGRSAMDEKYRSIYVEAVTPENVKRITTGTIGDIAYERDPSAFLEEVDEYLETGRGPDYVQEFVEITDEDLEANGYTKSEIRKARKAAEKGDYYQLYEMWKEVWDPRYTPEEVYPQLEGLGVPRKLYDLAVNKYRGSGRGTFNLRRR